MEMEQTNMHKINDGKRTYRVPISIGYCRINLSKKVRSKNTKTIKENVKKWLTLALDAKTDSKEG